MPAPVFGGTAQTVAGAVTAENVTLTGFGDSAGVQQMQISFERSLNMLYEIGTTNVYYVGDRRKGQVQCSRVVVGASGFAALVDTYGPLCNTEPLELSVRGENGCAGGGGETLTYTAQGVVLMSIGASVTAQDIVVTENMSFQFAEMDYEAA